MKTSTKAIIVTLYLNLFIAFNATSQEWVDLLQLPNSTYDQIVQSGDNYYNSNPELISIKGSGYKDFQRYKWYWKNRIAGTNNITEHNQRLADFRLSLANNSSLRTSNTINSDWKNLGPFNTPEFGNDGSSGNGWVSTIFVDRTTQKIKYCGSVTGGFWYLNENTNSWSPSNLNTFTFGVLDIEEDYINPDIVYISLGTEINFRQNGFGIWRSTDKGRNFTQISSPDIEPMEMVKKIRISPLNPNLMYATSVYGIYVYNIANDVCDII